MVPDINQSILDPLKKVTSVSRYLALFLFIVLPFIGGWIGYNLAPVTSTVPGMEISESIPDDVENIDVGPESNGLGEVVYQTVFVSNWDDSPNHNYKFLENSGNLYIFHSQPFDEGSVLKKIDGVTKFTELNYYKFDHIGSSYIKDGTYVIFAGEGNDEPSLLNGASPTDFRLVTSETGQVFGVDNESVYSGGKLLSGINPATMKIISSDQYSLGIVYDEDTFWFPEGSCHSGSYRIGIESEIKGFISPCSQLPF